MVSTMKKNRLPIIVSVGIILTIIIALSLGSSPIVEGAYTRIQFNPSVLSASGLDDNTELFTIGLYTTTGENYTYLSTGESILNVPENAVIDIILVIVTISDNYASTISEATARTMVELEITDDDAVSQYDNTFEGSDLSTTHDLNGYYLVIREYPCSISLTPGTWDIDAEYKVFAIPA